MSNSCHTPNFLDTTPLKIKMDQSSTEGYNYAYIQIPDQ